jgi:pyrroline-5-carboxylate reductase
MARAVGDDRNGRLAIVGVGAMGGSIVSGLIASGWPADRLIAIDSDGARLEQLGKQFGVAASPVVGDALGAEAIILAVKPHQIEAAIAELGLALAGQPRQAAAPTACTPRLLMSIAAGVELGSLDQLVRKHWPGVTVGAEPDQAGQSQTNPATGDCATGDCVVPDPDQTGQAPAGEASGQSAIAGNKAAMQLIRIMPNVAASVRQSMTAVCASSAGREYAQVDGVTMAKRVFSAVGQVAVIDESQMDAFTALAGSGPAAVLYLAEAMIDAGVLGGLPRSLAATLVDQTLFGTASLWHLSDDHPTLIKERVTSPGGTTIAGLAALEEHGVKAGVVAGVEAARRRSSALRRASQA